MIGREGTPAAHERRASVPQVMKPERVEARSLPEFSPAPVDIARLDRGADGGGEHESVFMPCCAEGQSLRVLPLAVLAQMPARELGQDDCPPRCAGLGLNDPQLAVRPLQRLAHSKLPRV